jgi:hypothetical protein
VLPLAVQVFLVAAAALYGALRRLVPSVRRRTVVAAVPVLLMPVVTDAVATPATVGGLAAGQLGLLVTVPVLALFWSVMALRRWERRRAG